jgi:hypothetical protein
MIKKSLQKLFSQLQYELVEITPAKAEKLLEHNVKNYRLLSRYTANRYADAMTAGKWYLNLLDPLLFIEEYGTLIVLNGQHRLRAVALSKTKQQFVQVVLTEETLPLYNDAATDNGVVRRIQDYFRAHSLGDKNAAALSYLLFRQLTGKRRGMPEEVAEVAYRYPEGVQFAASYDNCPARKGISIAVRAAIARAYYSQDRERLQRFGNMLARGDWSDPQGADSGVRLLYNLIYQQQLKFGGGGSATDHLYKYCEPAVYLFCQQKPRKILKPVKTVGHYLELPKADVFLA